MPAADSVQRLNGFEAQGGPETIFDIDAVARGQGTRQFLGVDEYLRHEGALPCIDRACQIRDLLQVAGVEIAGHRVLRCTSPAIPNAIAALLLYCRDTTGTIPHAYFGWTEGNPITYLLKFLAFGEGDTAPVTREVLRQAEPDPARRPRIHVG